ncbi:hypothetical protein AVEN_83085-1 [Araneus ventricosus]|uniref:ALK tyrosine kinase receptor n=1 Tax=Araneus ventricosus TaxID=182803 RepID=A0A4Y2APR3_ARAVE|nr:hypothetical protein AVEN_83085-1 [Araneus ventricosus]
MNFEPLGNFFRNWILRILSSTALILAMKCLDEMDGIYGCENRPVKAFQQAGVFVKGAGGAPGEDNRGLSLGASLRATFDWEGGDSIYILVGQKGVDPCSNVKISCGTMRTKRSFDKFKLFKQELTEGGGGGGGGATYVFKIDPVNAQKIPLAIAGGGGGLSAKYSTNESNPYILPHGLMPNNSILPINGYTGSGAGGGGGWDDNTNTATGGESLREGGRGGRACKRSAVWGTHGGFGGGGGGCASGAGGGGYRGK